MIKGKFNAKNLGHEFAGAVYDPVAVDFSPGEIRVKYKIYANEQAHADKKSPVAETHKAFPLNEETINQIVGILEGLSDGKVPDLSTKKINV